MRQTRRRFLQTLGAAGLAGLAGCSFGARETSESPPPTGSWPMYGNDAANTSHSKSRLSTDDLGKRWSARTASASVGSPVVDDGLIVYPGWTGAGAHDIEDGSELWTYSPLDVEDEAGRGVSATIGRNAVFGTAGASLAGESFVYAVSAASGEELWRTRGENAPATLTDPVYAPTVTDDALYVTSDDTVYALDPESGAVQWRQQHDLSTISRQTVGDGTVYVASHGRLLALDAANGERLWATRTSPDRSGFTDLADSPPVVADGTVYVGSPDGTVTAVNAAEGTRRWTAQISQFERWTTGGEVERLDVNKVQTAVAVADDTVYVTTDDGRLSALNAADGREQWTTGFDTTFSSAPAVADSTVVGGGGTAVYGVDVATGERLWSVPVDDTVVSQPAVLNGGVVVSGDDGRLAVIQ